MVVGSWKLSNKRINFTKENFFQRQIKKGVINLFA